MSEFSKIKISLKLSIGFSVADREDETFLGEHISENEWKKLNLFEKEQFIEDEILKEWAHNYIEMSAQIKEPSHD